MAIEIALHDTVGANDANGVLQAVEAGNLREDGALGVDAKTGKNLSDELWFEFPIFFGKCIDGRIEKILWDGGLPGEFGGSKHGAVGPGDKVCQGIRDGRIG